MWATTTTKRKGACICFVVDHVVDVDGDADDDGDADSVNFAIRRA